MSFYEKFKDAEFDGESLVDEEALKEFEKRLSDPAIEQYLNIVFHFLQRYHQTASLWLGEELARDMMLMVFARWLEEGRLI